MTEALRITPSVVYDPPFQHLNVLPSVLQRDFDRIVEVLVDRGRRLPPLIETFARLQKCWEGLESSCKESRAPYNIFIAIDENRNLRYTLFGLRFELLRADVSRMFAPNRYETDVPGHFEVNLARTLEFDYDKLIERDIEYNASWKKRGGVGAFMMLARKWDRLEPMVAKYDGNLVAMLHAKPDRVDDVEDLRRYLELVESEYLRTSIDSLKEKHSVLDKSPMPTEGIV